LLSDEGFLKRKTLKDEDHFALQREICCS